MKPLDTLTGDIIDAAMKIHTDLGPGLLESVYEAVLEKALQKRGYDVKRQLSVTFEYDGIVFDEGFRADLVIDGRVVVELKSVEELVKVHRKQVLTYLRLMDLRVGLLLNFGAASLKDGLQRIANGIDPDGSTLRVNQP